jgi:hypothetical protein
MQCGEDIGVAVMQERRVGSSDAKVVDRGGVCEGEIEEGVAKEWAVGEIAIEPADRIEGGREVVATAPKLGRVERERGAIASETA